MDFVRELEDCDSFSFASILSTLLQILIHEKQTPNIGRKFDYKKRIKQSQHSKEKSFLQK
jgi:hypothetical protein